MNNTSVDSFLAEGCGRCEHYQTPQCKVHLWTEELVLLRELLQETELTEEMKWGSPCYTLDGGNVVNLTALRDCCALGFFKGALLDDPDGVLEAPGPNSQAVRMLKFTSADQIREQHALASRFIAQAIALEKAGAKVAFKKRPEPIPEELQAALDADPALEAAWKALTPGRQRSHILQVSGAKLAATRARRVQKCVPKILAGKSYLDR